MLCCVSHSHVYISRDAADIAYLNLANALHRSHMSRDAMIPLKMALEISPDVNVLHYTLANVYVVRLYVHEHYVVRLYVCT